MTAAQDDRELFDVVDRDGSPLGFTKARAAVHRDGDWHRSIHVWVWGLAGGEPHVVLQLRSRAKDTHPGAFDVAVTGHLRAGESVDDALREAEEEIGLVLQPSAVVVVGRRRRVDRGAAVRDHELQTILLASSPADLAALVPSPAEVDALVALPLSAAARVLCDGGEAEVVKLAGATAELPAGTTLRATELVPAPDGYYARAMASVAAHVAGRPVTPWDLG